ncbi:hypothetical protein THAOC_21700 [Thalassiosira oceanica]|uniref:Uncharacterized protein n=1 Tax=Thalassiosira oceanica TaxID=159749 RepID=K0RWT6_THAOC|nr:hypothetical protein THAOC_21700 [Thalassiosira oceanica]|eukprot:EJK58193.1 hypothetical protein THAOC_21700 [Thalassiosira oceanica]
MEPSLIGAVQRGWHRVRPRASSLALGQTHIRATPLPKTTLSYLVFVLPTLGPRVKQGTAPSASPPVPPPAAPPPGCARSARRLCTARPERSRNRKRGTGMSQTGAEQKGEATATGATGGNVHTTHLHTPPRERAGAGRRAVLSVNHSTCTSECLLDTWRRSGLSKQERMHYRGIDSSKLEKWARAKGLVETRLNLFPREKIKGSGIKMRLEMPSLPKISLPFGSKDPTPPSQPPPSGGDAIAAALGGAVYGSAAGLYVDIATDIQSTDLPAQLPPVALGVAVGAAAFVGVNQGGIVGTVAKFIFAGPVNYVKNIIARKVDQIVDDIKSTPQRVQDAAVKKVEDTVDDIKETEIATEASAEADNVDADNDGTEKFTKSPTAAMGKRNRLPKKI